MNVLMFTYWDRRKKDEYTFKEIAQLTNNSKAEYARIHGYNYGSHEIVEYNREIGWYKIEFIKRELISDRWDYIFYCEADCMITNLTKRIEDIIDDNYDITIAKNSVSKGWDGLNCGNLIIRNSLWSKKFLEYWDNRKEFYNHNQAEQGALIDMFNSNIIWDYNLGNIKENFKIVSPRTMGGFRHQWYPKDNWQPGDWIMHLAGCHNSYRYDVFNYMKDKIIKHDLNFTLPFEPFV